jgi:hypothetical protein
MKTAIIFLFITLCAFNVDAQSLVKLKQIEPLDSVTTFTGTVEQVRALSGKRYTTIFTTNFGGGTWLIDQSDTISQDNTGSILVTADGKRYKKNAVVNIESFGAIGYTTEEVGPDSKAAIQAAINAVGDHGTVIIPSGKQFYVSGTIYIDNFNVKIVSESKSSYLPNLRSDGDYPIFHVRHAGFVCENVGFQGNGQADTGEYTPLGTAILLNRDDGTHDPNFANIDAKIEGCLFTYLERGIICNGRNLLAFNNDFSNCLNGIRVDRVPNTDCRGHQIIKNRFHSNGQGERAISGESWCVEFTSPVAFGNTIKDNVIDGKSRGFYKGGLNQNTISGNEMTLAYGPLLHIIDPAGTFWHSWTIDNNKASGVQGPLLSAGSSMEWGIISEGAVSNGKIMGNTIAFSRYEGMRFASLSAVELCNNIILTPNKLSATTDSSKYDGIYIGGGGSNKVDNNFIRSTISPGHRFGINNKGTASVFTFNYGYNHTGGLFADSSSNSYTNRVQNDVEPNNVVAYGNFVTNEYEGGFAFNMINDLNKKLQGGNVNFRRKSGTPGTETIDVYIRSLNNGVMTNSGRFFSHGGLTIGERSGKELLQNSALNARVVYADMIRFAPSSSGTTASNTFFVDETDNVLKCKDGDSKIRRVQLSTIIDTATDANFTATFSNQILLPEITDNRTINLASFTAKANELIFWNRNTSENTWTFMSSNVIDAAGTTYTVIPNQTIVHLVRWGNNWIVK